MTLQHTAYIHPPTCGCSCRTWSRCAGVCCAISVASIVVCTPSWLFVVSRPAQEMQKMSAALALLRQQTCTDNVCQTVARATGELPVLPAPPLGSAFTSQPCTGKKSTFVVGIACSQQEQERALLLVMPTCLPACPSACLPGCTPMHRQTGPIVLVPASTVAKWLDTWLLRTWDQVQIWYQTHPLAAPGPRSPGGR